MKIVKKVFGFIPFSRNEAVLRSKAVCNTYLDSFSSNIPYSALPLFCSLPFPRPSLYYETEE